MTPQERAQRWRQEIESEGGRIETILEAVAQLLADVARLGGQVSGEWLPDRGHRMLTLPQAARQLAISERTLKRWIADRRIKPHLEDPIRFKIEALDNVAKARKKR